MSDGMNTILRVVGLAGVFGDGEDDPKPPADDKTQPPADDKKKAEGDDKQPPADKRKPPVQRIDALVTQRNEARRRSAELEAEVTTLKQRVEQLQSNDGAAQITALQQQIAKLQADTTRIDDEFDTLLETELEAFSESAQDAVKAIPGTPRDRYRWLVANRALLGGKGPDDKKPSGPTHDKKPGSGDGTGPAPMAKSYVEARKPAKSGYSGLA